MVTSPTGKGVIVMGGDTVFQDNSKAMLELTQTMEWTRLEQTSQIKHHGSQIAIPIPDELVCQKNESKNIRLK